MRLGPRLAFALSSTIAFYIASSDTFSASAWRAALAEPMLLCIHHAFCAVTRRRSSPGKVSQVFL
jgi:hypothetical protein